MPNADSRPRFGIPQSKAMPNADSRPRFGIPHQLRRRCATRRPQRLDGRPPPRRGAAPDVVNLDPPPPHDASIMHPRLANRHRTEAGLNPPLTLVTVAHHEPMTAAVEARGMFLEVRRHLGLDRLGQQPLRPVAQEARQHVLSRNLWKPQRGSGAQCRARSPWKPRRFRSTLPHFVKGELQYPPRIRRLSFQVIHRIWS
ncbi:MAG: hypothetical protein FLDDKLPJ_01340 [Phycisphaerae bacterium]|nr:hypothetical protein [Phycisphaerae bacterium]